MARGATSLRSAVPTVGTAPSLVGNADHHLPPIRVPAPPSWPAQPAMLPRDRAALVGNAQTQRANELHRAVHAHDELPSVRVPDTVYERLAAEIGVVGPARLEAA